MLAVGSLARVPIELRNVLRAIDPLWFRLKGSRLFSEILTAYRDVPDVMKSDTIAERGACCLEHATGHQCRQIKRLEANANLKRLPTNQIDSGPP